MTILTDHPITRRWAPENPDVIQLYSFPTPNGVKASIALEELGLAYEPHLVTLADADVKSPEFLSLNPNGKIPAIIDPDGPDGAPIGLFESGAILIYLAEKTGKLIGKTARERHVITQWLMFQMGGVGPIFGQLGDFFAQGGEHQDHADNFLRSIKTWWFSKRGNIDRNTFGHGKHDPRENQPGEGQQGCDNRQADLEPVIECDRDAV